MKSFKLTNVKSFEDTGEIELKPITVFVGRNSSGKSSLIRFPVVLAQTFLEDTISPIVFNGKYVDYGNFEDVVHNHTGDSLTFELRFELQEAEIPIVFPYILIPVERDDSYSKPPRTDHDSSKDHEVKLSITLLKQKDKIIVSEYTLSIDQQNLLYAVKDNDTYKILLNAIYDKTRKLATLNNPVVFSITPHFEKFVMKFDFFLSPFGSQKQLVSVFESIAKTYYAYDGTVCAPIRDILRHIDLENQNFESRAKTHYGDTSKPRVPIQDILRDALGEKFRNQIAEGEQLTIRDQKIAAGLNFVIMTLKFIDRINAIVRARVSDFSQHLSYIGPFRTNPERTYRHSESLYNYVGKQGEHAITLLRQTAKNQSPLFEKVSAWFFQAMGYKLNIEDITGSNLYRIKVYTDHNLDGDNLIDAGFGLSQILPIVVQLHYDKNWERENRPGYYSIYIPEIFVFEQPELHLHPNAQAELANLFVDRVLDQERKAQILIETHSEHLIRRLQSLVANPDNDFDADKLAIYYVDITAEGCSRVLKMEMTADGQFKQEWPSGFFDKAYELSREFAHQMRKRHTQ